MSFGEAIKQPFLEEDEEEEYEDEIDEELNVGFREEKRLLISKTPPEESERTNFSDSNKMDYSKTYTLRDTKMKSFFDEEEGNQKRGPPEVETVEDNTYIDFYKMDEDEIM